MARDMEVTAIELSKVDTTYSWNAVAEQDFDCFTLFQNTDWEKQPRLEVVTRVCAALDRCRANIVALPGWTGLATFAALKWCVDNHVPALVMSDSTQWDHKRHWWKESIKRSLIRFYSAGLVAGKPHRVYLTGLGMPADHIFTGYDAIDNDYFRRKSLDTRSQSQEMRTKYSLPERYFLASARFIEKKNLFRLLDAYAGYRRIVEASNKQCFEAAHLTPWSLVLLGDGVLRRDIETRILALKLQDHIVLPGFKQYEELPVYYGLAESFVHASTTEQWGLVINEAMASGLPVLVSNRCGCATDLVREGENGFTFDPGNTEALARLMADVSVPEFPLIKFGSRSSAIISVWGLEKFVSGMAGAIDCALNVGAKNAKLADRILLNCLIRA